MAWAQWINEVRPSDDPDAIHSLCPGCRDLYFKREPPEDPPCETCRVELKVENEEAAKLFFLVSRQVIVGMAGVIDINHIAIHAAMELYGVKDKKRCFEKILRVFHELKKEEAE